jgi:hypothetical protein
MNSEFVLVEKEAIADFNFPPGEVLKLEKEIEALKIELKRAIALGNMEHQKVKIYFEDDKKKKKVETTIWAVTDHEIVLKQNVTIPIRRIYKLVI